MLPPDLRCGYADTAPAAHMQTEVFQKFASDESVFEGGVKGLDIQYYTRF